MATQDKEIQALQGMNALLYIRLLKNADKEDGQLVPMQTSMDFDLKRDSDSTTTKSGNVNTTSSIETELKTEFIDNISKVSDDLYDAIMNNERVEAWKINIDRINDKGQYFAWYMRGSVTEDSNGNDSDDNATRELTFSIDGKPKRGWLTLPESAKEELDYVFRGIVKTTSSDSTGQGTAYNNDTDRGTGSNKVTPSVSGSEDHSSEGHTG
uniref:phage major tail protein, TP901-1 family n=1 Tax=Lactobacillus acidophilus TaxID=1579 RepID=UPI003F562F51